MSRRGRRGGGLTLPPVRHSYGIEKYVGQSTGRVGHLPKWDWEIFRSSVGDAAGNVWSWNIVGRGATARQALANSRLARRVLQRRLPVGTLSGGTAPILGVNPLGIHRHSTWGLISQVQRPRELRRRRVYSSPPP